MHACTIHFYNSGYRLLYFVYTRRLTILVDLRVHRATQSVFDVKAQISPHFSTF